MSEHTLSTCIDDYLAYRQVHQKANTVRNDGRTLRKFLAIVGNVITRNVTPGMVDHYFSVRSDTCQKATLNNELDTLSAFFKWCRLRKRCPAAWDPIAERKRWPVPKTSKRTRVPVEDFRRVISCGNDPRDRMILSLGFYTFQRQSEIISMTVGDVDLAGGFLATLAHKSEVRDEMPVCEELEEDLREWLTHYAARVDRPLRPTDALVPAMTNGNYRGRRGVRGLELIERGNYIPDRPLMKCYEQIKVALGRAGYPTKWSGGHTLRASGARALYDTLSDEGHDRAIRIVQSMLHHAEISTTERYIGVDPDVKIRNERLRGKRMFAVRHENVVPLRVVQ